MYDIMQSNLDISEMFADRQFQRNALHTRYLNEQLVRVLKTIGYDVGFQRGQGQYLFDRDNDRYLDLLSGFGVFALGRNHPAVKNALKSVLDSDLPNLVQLDLSTLASGIRSDPTSYPGAATGQPNPAVGVGQPLPPPPSRNPSATGALAAVAPPSDTPRDQYDLGYGYILRKDYALAESALKTFLSKYPNDRLAPDAQFWLGESLFQRQRYDAAAQAYLDLSTKHGSHAKAPEALLRLGQSLAALGQKEMSCATLAEVGRKFPRAPNNVKQGVEREQKRVRC